MQEMRDENHCETILLDDLPAESDAFASDGDCGPHQRVADALAEMIESAEVGGKAIGLEGGWGSGKSTIVRFLSERFSRNDDYTVVVFDAWAHEGDPLRRTFIESIVRELSEYGWADKAAWKEKLEELANRRKRTRTLITPNATLFGTLSAMSLLLIPLGLALTNAGLRQGVTLDVDRPINWFFTLGLLLVLSPFWILIVRTLQVLFKVRRTPRLSDFAFVSNEAVSETHTETIETPEPTSLEFEGYFRDLMAEALSENSRRLLLVLDNLDRVDSDTALSIWGTLQTFLHDRDHESDFWHKQLWVVVPYDPIRIRKLWNQPDKQEVSDVDGSGRNGANEARRTTESFLDKSFQVRFHVAPPVLSDWKSFLYELVKIALPGHFKDRHMVYRVFDHCRARDGGPPTPRELKLFVNQIGAIHRQWQHEFPIGHVAFFVLARKSHHHLIDALREGELPNESDCRLLDDEFEDHDLKSSLAGLAFNVMAVKGLELLLGDSIVEALKSPDPENLKRIAARNGDGFWAVLETVAATRWHEEDAHSITGIASRLQTTELLESYSGPEKPAVVRALREAGVNMKTWMPVSKVLGDGIADLLRIQADPEFSEAILKKFCNQLAKINSSEKDTSQAATVVETLFPLFDVAKSLGHGDAIPKTVTLPFKGEKWIASCREIAEHDNEQRYWNRLRASGKADEVSAAFVSKISAGESEESDVTAVKVTQRSATKTEWQGVCTALQERLDHSQNVTADECAQVLSVLFELESLDVDAASSAQESLSNPGHLLHHFHAAKTQNEYAAQAALIFSFARQRPKLAKPTAVGNSDAGHQLLVQAVASPEGEVTSSLYDLAERHGLLHLVLGIVQSADTPHALFVAVLKRVADSESPEMVFTSEVIKNDWRRLRQQLNEESASLRFQKLVGSLARSHGLCETLQETGFDPKSAIIYLDIIRAAENLVPEFVQWCREGLRQMTKEEWLADLAGNNGACAVCIELSTQSHAPDLANSFSDGLQEHAQAVIQGKDIPTAWITKTWPTVVDCIDVSSGTRKVLRENLVEIAISAKGTISNEFFDMYGIEISDSTILALHPHVLSRLFSPLVSENHQRGLAWLDEFSQGNPGFIGKVEAEHTGQDFTSRLQGLVDNPTEEDIQPIIESIAAHFGIEATPQPESPDDRETEDDEDLTASEKDSETS